MDEVMNCTVEVQKLGRITLPYETRKYLNIDVGDLIVIEIKGIRHLAEVPE